MCGYNHYFCLEFLVFKPTDMILDKGAPVACTKNWLMRWVKSAFLSFVQPDSCLNLPEPGEGILDQ